MKYKLQVDKLFVDKFDHKTEYKIGDEIIVEEERKNDLVERGLAHIIEELKKDIKTKKKTSKE